jgi:DUF1680 family protein
VRVELRDGFWAPRQAQHRDHTLAVILERLEEHGSVDNFRRLGSSGPDVPFRGMHFADSDVHKWMEAAAWAGRLDLLEPVLAAVLEAQDDDGYLHTHYGHDGRARYQDLDFGHELYCQGHFIEAALAHHAVTGSTEALEAATRVADHLGATFGPGRDDRTDGHPEIELALARLAARTGRNSDLDLARWMVESRLAAAGIDLQHLELAGHAVRALYLATAIAEIALATGEDRWVATAQRLFDQMVDQRSYPTGAVGGRWLGEAVGQAFELPEAMSYAESCAAVAATRFSARVWHLSGDPRALDRVELLLYNAVPAGVAADGEHWFYSQPHAVGPESVESNPWPLPFDYGQAMLLEWFPPRRHPWFVVPCCPPNLARLAATVDQHVASLDPRGDLWVHLPVACRITGGGWDLEVASPWPEGGTLQMRVTESPPGATVRVRRPSAGGTPSAHVVVRPGGTVDLDATPTWWGTDPRVEGADGTVVLRCGPVVHCVEGVDLPGVDLRLLVVDPAQPPERAFGLRGGPGVGLHRPWDGAAQERIHPVTVPTVPYHSWANRGPTTMRMRFPVRRGMRG